LISPISHRILQSIWKLGESIGDYARSAFHENGAADTKTRLTNG
jgi:hypothetical protein